MALVPAPADVPTEARRLWKLGFPVSISMVGLTLMGTVDTIVVGTLGEEPLAMVALGNLGATLIAIFGHTGMRGLDPVITQAFGSNDRSAASNALVRGSILAVVLGFFLAISHSSVAEILTMLGQPAALTQGAEDYALARAWGLPLALLFDAWRQFLQGQGIMRPATVVVLALNVLNLVLDLWWVRGGLGVPPLGVQGCGYATAVVQICTPIGLWLVAGQHLRAWWPAQRVRTSLAEWITLARLFAVSGVQGALEVWAFAAAGLMMGMLGTTEVAAHAVVMNLITLAFMVPFGLSAAAATRVGNLVGAQLPWTRVGWTAVAMGMGMMMLSGSLFFLFPEPLVGLYTREPAVIAVALAVLPIAAMFQVFDGAQVVLFGVLRGAGDVEVPTVMNLFAYWVIGIPLGAVLAFTLDMGPRGVWLGLLVSLVSVSLLLSLRLLWVSHRR